MAENTYPKVSVIVPVYEVEQYIGQCAVSLFSQTWKNCEFIFVDDGSDDIEMSLQMLRSIVRQGCGRVFATPHSGYAFYRYHTRALDSFRRLQEAVKKAEIPVEIYLGCEIYTTRDKIKDNLLRLRCNQFPSMNGTRYVMAEFSTSRGSYEDARFCLTSYLEEGWIPIIAHAERYGWEFASVENISILKEMGCLVQVNFYDLYEEPDESVRTLAQDLVKAELVDLMGSDAHRMDHRRPKLTKGAEYIREHCSPEYAENVLWRNAEMMLL